MTPPEPAAPPTPTAQSLPKLSNREVRDLKGQAQRLNAVVKLGKGGVSDEFLAGVDRELAHHGLIKVKLTELKDQRFEVAETVAARTQAHLIGVIGHVVVLYRPRPENAPPQTPPPQPKSAPASRPVQGSSKARPPKA